jgi:hypothetical protein
MMTQFSSETARIVFASKMDDWNMVKQLNDLSPHLRGFAEAVMKFRRFLATQSEENQISLATELDDGDGQSDE